MHINYNGEIETTTLELSKALGNFPRIIDILKRVSDADDVDLLFYDEKKEQFLDKIKGNTISIAFLNDSTSSILAKVYCQRTAYYSSHTLYDKCYNVSIDDPYRVNISTQIVIPVTSGERLVGIIRFSKHKYTFERFMLKKLMEFQDLYVKIFSLDVVESVKEFNKEFFSIGIDEVFNILDQVKTGLERLSAHTHNPEIHKLILRAEENMESVCEYLNPAAFIEEIEKESIKQVVEKAEFEYRHYHILLADDVEMNVRILNAMIKSDKHYDISFAYDGEDALQKIKESQMKKNSINILFLDHYMPGKLGLEVAQTIRESEKQHGDQKIIIVSITNDPKAIESQKYLYNYHISKPFVKSDIVDVLDKIQHDLHDS